MEWKRAQETQTIGAKRVPFTKLAYCRYIQYAVDKSFLREQGMHEANLTREIHDVRGTIM